MTCNHTSFDAYHWLPEENPANVIEIPSDDEEVDSTHTAAGPCADPVDQEAPQEAEPTAEAKAASTAFRETIQRSMPIYLMPFPMREYLRSTTIHLLERASNSGVALAAVSIDAHGLPTWPGLHSWDTDAQSLHDVLQSRLFERRDVEAVTDAWRALPALVQLSNERLAEALALNLRLCDLTVGYDLLPTWGGRDGDDASVTTIEAGSSVHSDHVPPSSAARVAGEEAQLPSAWSSDTDSSDADGAAAAAAAEAAASECDDEVGLFNLINDTPTYGELGAEVPLTHVIHDVEVYGAASGAACGQTLDFGMYLAREDDSEVDELPEVELVVDEETFAHHYHLADAIDVELAGEGIFCLVPRTEAAAAEGVAGEAEEVPDYTMESTEEVPDYTMESTEEDEGASTNEPVTPTSMGDGQAQTDWIVL